MMGRRTMVGMDLDVGGGDRNNDFDGCQSLAEEERHGGEGISSRLRDVSQRRNG